MRVLWVKAGKLLPVDTGGRIRSYHLLRQLRPRHDLTLLSYYGGRPDPEYDRALAVELPGAVTVATGAPGEMPLRQALDYLRRLPSAAPYAVTKFTSPRVRRLVTRWLGERRFDVAVCDFLSASLNFPARLDTPSVLFQHNVESVLWDRQARVEPNPIKRLAFRIEARRMHRYEAATVRRFHQVIAVSDRDCRSMRRMTDPERITVVPTGVDLQQYRAAAGPPATRPLVMFLGSMDWEANVDAVDHFCRDIWPHVRTEVPGARFRIVGRNPHLRVQRLAGESVEVTGRVPAVTDHLREAAVFVVPLRVGGGTRLKIFEAMAMGKAVVSTTIGAEGLDVEAGRDLILADDAPAFAAATVRLLRDVELRRRFEAAAAAVAARYDWSVVVERFDEVLARAAADAGGHRPEPADAAAWKTA
jgi:polysaccharide biosynthesis protein PslH